MTAVHVFISSSLPCFHLQLKCHQYWPLGCEEGYEDEMVFNEVGLQVALQGENDFGNFTIHWIMMTDLLVGSGVFVRLSQWWLSSVATKGVWTCFFCYALSWFITFSHPKNIIPNRITTKGLWTFFFYYVLSWYITFFPKKIYFLTELQRKAYRLSFSILPFHDL